MPLELRLVTRFRRCVKAEQDANLKEQTWARSTLLSVVFGVAEGGLRGFGFAFVARQLVARVVDHADASERMFDVGTVLTSTGALVPIVTDPVNIQ